MLGEGTFLALLRFLHEHREELKQVPLAIFALAMSLTSNGEQATVKEITSSRGGVLALGQEPSPAAS